MNKPESDGAAKKSVYLLVLIAAGFVVYFAGLRADYYGDDLSFIFDDPLSKIGYYFTHRNPFGFYRPIEGAFLAAVQAGFDLSTVPIHVTHIVMHAVLCWMVLVFMIRSGFPRVQAGVAAAFMLVSQVNVIVVMSNDTFSQLAGTLFGCLSLYLLYLAFFEKGNGGLRERSAVVWRWYVLSPLVFAVALLSKETSVSFGLLIAGLVLIRMGPRGADRRPVWIRNAVLTLIPYVVTAVLYLAIRSLVLGTQPALGEGRNEFQLDMNIVKNLGMCFAVMSSPFSSVSVMNALSRHEYTIVALYGVCTMGFAGLVLAGLVLTGRRRSIALFSFFTAAALFPMVVLNHVSEAHAYNAMPFFSVLVGIGLGTVYNRLTGRRWQRLVFVALVVSCFWVQYQSAQSKTGIMVENGERAARLLKQIEPYVGEVPENGRLTLVNPPGDSLEYSVFTFRGFNVLSLGLRRSIERLTGRTDITLRIVDSAGNLKRNDTHVILGLSNWVVQVYD